MSTGSLDLGRVWHLLRRRWKIILACVVVVMGAAYAYVSTATPRYQATAQVAYQEPPRDSPIVILPNTGDREADMNTLATNAANFQIVSNASQTSGVPTKELQQSVDSLVSGDSNILNVTARSSSAQRAALMANNYAAAIVSVELGQAQSNLNSSVKLLQSQIKDLGPAKENDPNASQRAQLQSTLAGLQVQQQSLKDSLVVSNKASTPTSPVWPHTLLTMIVAFIVGLGLGCGVGLLTASVDRKLRAEHIDELPAPVIVQVPRSASALRGEPIAPTMAEPIVADAFAALGARIMLDRKGEGAHIVLVASAHSGEGKSTTSANLASALARGGRRVVLVDADMRRPTQDVIFPSLQGRRGLADLLGGAAEVEHALTLVQPNLAAIGSGPRQLNASLLLSSVGFRTLVERLSEISEVVIIDAPPVLPVTDSLAIAPVADQVLLCCQIGTSDLGQIEQAHARLASAAATPQSIVLIGSERPLDYGYGSGPRPADLLRQHRSPTAYSSLERDTFGPPPPAPGSPAARANEGASQADGSAA